MPDAAGAGIVRTVDGKWTAARLKGEAAIVVFAAPSPEAARALLNKVAEAIK